MAITRKFDSVKARIEVQNGEDKNFMPTYGLKSIHQVKTDATDEQIKAVSEAIKLVLKAESFGDTKKLLTNQIYEV